MNWYESHVNVMLFARHMVDEYAWDVADLLSFLEKPWKWTPERDVWVGQTGSATRE